MQRFPNLPFADYVNGPYALDKEMRKQWEEKEEFPPYEFALERGKELFESAFKSGKAYADCFPEKGIGVRQNYPLFDTTTGEVITLELALNRCREANGEPPLSYVGEDMAALTAYMAYTSRGKPFDIKIPDDPRALAAFENGRKYFYQRRGQLNFSCASCHVQMPGEHLRAEVLAPALGILAAMPIYRSEWGSMGTISRRFTTCNSQVRATPLKPQDKSYRDVEFYLSYMSNGLPISGPGARP
jgi:sulfur-oxidizing protein SoxA